MNGQIFYKKQLPQSILCAIDFSDSSRHALKWTVEMAEQLHAHIVILYTFRLLQSKSSEALLTKRRIEEQAVTNFAIIEKEFFHNKGLSYEFTSEVGFVTDRVENQVKKKPVHLLVVDKKWSRENKEIFDELLELVQVPLVIVP